MIIERLVRAAERGVKVHVLAQLAHTLKMDQLVEGVGGPLIMHEHSNAITAGSFCATTIPTTSLRAISIAHLNPAIRRFNYAICRSSQTA